MDNGNGTRRQIVNKYHRATIAVNGLPVPPQGYSIALYFNGAGEFIQRINEHKISLHPWLGVQLEAYNDGVDWSRKSIGEYEPIDVNRWLMAKEGKEPLPGISTPGKP